VDLIFKRKSVAIRSCNQHNQIGSPTDLIMLLSNINNAGQIHIKTAFDLLPIKRKISGYGIDLKIR